jgi:hypothetical protein
MRRVRSTIEGGDSMSFGWRSCILTATALLAVSMAAAAQTVRTGSISGTITDESGAALPGVTVTLTSPVLQTPQLVKVSEARGEYQFTELPPGSYTVTYELAGFSKLVREEIRLTTAFAARIDVVLKVASLQETVVVSGQSPLVDVSNTRGGGTVTKELLSELPTNKNYYDTMLLVPGAQIQGPPQVGEIGFRAVVGGHKTYGLSGNTSNSVEGIEMMSNEAPDFANVEEVDVKTYGNTAEAGAAAGVIQLIIPSGGNQFHGRISEQAIHKRFNSINVDDALRAQGISEGDAMNYFNAFTADLGGRIVRDKLWFYGAINDSRNERTAPGFADAPGPDGRYGTLDDVAGALPGRNKNRTIKMTGHIGSGQRLIGFFTRNPFDEDKSRADRYIPYETTLKLNQTGQHGKAEWNGTFGSKLFATTMFGRGGYKAQYWLQDQSVGVPNRLNRNTTYESGGSFDSRSTIARTYYRYQLNGTMSYYPPDLGGTHELQAGYRAWWGGQKIAAPSKENASGEPIADPNSIYRLVYDTVGGVPNTPVEFHVRNYPYDGLGRLDEFALYASDSWRPTKRVTLNLGFRWERSVAYVPAQEKVQGPFGNAGSYSKVDAGDWTAPAPRLGVAIDLFGDGKTVAKASYGRYNVQWALQYAQDYNQNQQTTIMYRWRDPDGNNDYTPGEVNLNLNGPDFIGISGSSNNTINPDLKWPYVNEYSLSLEHELGHNLSVRGLFLQKSALDQYAAVNTLRPYDVWNVALTRRDPGPDGILNNGDDAGSITVYDYDPAYRGAAFVNNIRLTADRDDWYRNYEVTLSRRKVGKWHALTSFLATKNHRWLTLIPTSPNDNYNDIDETWELSFRAAAGYDLPYGVKVSTLYSAYNGLPGQRTYIFRAADPDGGRAMPSSTNITLRTEPFGERKGPARHIVNFRASKQIRFAGGRKVSFDVDALNLFNTNVAWGSPTGSGPGFNYASGPTFGQVLRIVTPRSMRFGVSLDY